MTTGQQTDQEAQILGQALPDSSAAPTPDSQAVTDLKYDTPESIRAAAEKNPALKKVLADFENTGAQKALSRVRREQGSNETVQAYHQRLVEDIARRVANGEELGDLGKDTPLFAKANREAVASEMFKSLFTQAKEFDPDSVAALESVVDQDELTAENWMALAQASINAVVKSTQKGAINEWLNAEDEEFPSDSKRYKALEERLRKQMESELNARQVEGKVIADQAPPIPTGKSTETVTRTSLEAMNPDQRLQYVLSLTDAERSQLWDVAMTQ